MTKVVHKCKNFRPVKKADEGSLDRWNNFASCLSFIFLMTDTRIGMEECYLHMFN